METLDLIRYIINNYLYPNELSKARLNKIIYLIDWKSAIENYQQVTNINWVFNHYGPYVTDIESLILNDNRFRINSTTNIYGNEKNIIKLVNDKNFKDPNQEIKQIIDFVLEKTKKFYWNEFISLVYSTYPIISQEKGSELNLVELAKEYNELKTENKND